MLLNKESLHKLCTQAIKAAKEASQYISSYNKKDLIVNTKQESSNEKNPCGGTSDASLIVTNVDLKSQEIILEILNPSIQEFDLGLLTEEMTDDSSRLEKDYFWCIDPLDGTLPFSQGLEGYSVSIALVDKTGLPIIGVVCNPITMDVYHAIKGYGSFKNNVAWNKSNNQLNNNYTFINDRSFSKHKHHKSITTLLTLKISSQGYSAFKMIKQGGAVMNAIWVLEHQPACYFKLPKEEKGGGSIWDFTATTCIFTEFNAHVSNILGEKLDLNNAATTFMNTQGVIYNTCETVLLPSLLKEFIL